MSEKMKRGTYYQWKGCERVPLPEQETVGIDLGDGNYVELHYRRSDGEAFLFRQNQCGDVTHNNT